MTETRIIYDPSLPSPSGSAQHVYLELGDPLGSTDIIVDRETSELVERRTDQAFGAEETDLRPNPRWHAFREDYRFTGKEDDVAFGLTYFGARYYAPALARWASPDPLTEHAALSGLNPYTYAGNSPLQYVDSLGLQGQECADACDSGGSTSGDTTDGWSTGGGVSGPVEVGTGGPNPNAPWIPATAPPPPPPVPVYGPPTIEQSRSSTMTRGSGGYIVPLSWWESDQYWEAVQEQIVAGTILAEVCILTGTCAATANALEGLFLNAVRAAGAVRATNTAAQAAAIINAAVNNASSSTSRIVINYLTGRGFQELVRQALQLEEENFESVSGAPINILTTPDFITAVAVGEVKSNVASTLYYSSQIEAQICRNDDAGMATFDQRRT